MAASMNTQDGMAQSSAFKTGGRRPHRLYRPADHPRSLTTGAN